MTTFTCLPCNYTAKTKTNLNIHMKSLKHEKNCLTCKPLETNTPILETNTLPLETNTHLLETNTHLLEEINSLKQKVKELEVKLECKKEENEYLKSLIDKLMNKPMEQPKIIEKVVEQPKIIEIQNVEVPKIIEESVPLKQPMEVEKVVLEPKKKKKVLMKDFLKEHCEEAMTINELVYSAEDSFTIDFLKEQYKNRDEDYPWFVARTYFQYLDYVMDRWNINKYKRPFHLSDINRQILFVNTNKGWNDLGEKEIGNFLNSSDGFVRDLNRMFLEKLEEYEEHLTKEEYRYNKRLFVMFDPSKASTGENFENCPLAEGFSVEGCYMSFFNQFHLPEEERN